MKKNTNNSKSAGLKVAVLAIALVAIPSMQAQVKNNGILYIKANSKAHVKSGAFTFGAASNTATNRSANYGILSFGSSATAAQVPLAANQFVNGYMSYLGTAEFLMPLGDRNLVSSFVGLIKVQPTSTNGVDAAYNHNTGPNTTTVGSNILAVSTVEHWDINARGNNEATLSKIALSWNPESNIGILTSNVDAVTIVGYNGTNWVEIPSTVQTSNLTGDPTTISTGSVQSNSPVAVSSFQFYTLGVKDVCAPVVLASGFTKTWENGAWTGSDNSVGVPPTISDNAIVKSNFAGPLSCFTLVIDGANTEITLADNETAEIYGNVTGSGKIVMANQASVVQTLEGASAPNVLMTKLTNPMRRFDYVFLSTPITNGTTFFNGLTDPQKTRVDGDAIIRPLGAFKQMRTFATNGLTAIDATANDAEPGEGFSATVRSQAPYSTAIAQMSDWENEKKIIKIVTEGVANNGDVNVFIPKNGYARVGNPYPSAINGAEMLDAMGPNINKTIYYWTPTSARKIYGNQTLNYNNNDFASWNGSGGVRGSTNGGEVPNGIIASMNSVMVKSTDLVNDTNFNITNCMRETTGNDVFFRTAATPKDRFWLDLTGSADSYSQILIAYIPESTLDFDNGYDGSKFGGANTSNLTSLIGTRQFAIQSRSAFDITDAVPLQVNKLVEETLTISLSQKEGIFNETTVFLHDKTLQVYHDLTESAYTFIQSAASDASRFEVVYQNSVLGNGDFSTKSAFAYISNNEFRAQASGTIAEIAIYDIAGRLVITYSGINEQGFSSNFDNAQGVYIAKIKLTDGTVVNQKVIQQ